MHLIVLLLDPSAKTLLESGRVERRRRLLVVGAVLLRVRLLLARALGHRRARARNGGRLEDWRRCIHRDERVAARGHGLGRRVGRHRLAVRWRRGGGGLLLLLELLDRPGPHCAALVENTLQTLGPNVETGDHEPLRIHCKGTLESRPAEL